jgi:hypothetical protein
MKKGLKINNKIIKKISGPINIRILKPSLESFLQYKNPTNEESGNMKLPLIILFGDVHGSFTATCSPCDEDDKSKECFSIYKTSFLDLFNNISTKYKHPIDFFIEDSLNLHLRKLNNDLYTKKNEIFVFPSHGPLGSFINSVHHCTDHKSKYYNSVCKFKNTRIHFGDFRQISPQETEFLIFTNPYQANRKIISNEIYLEKILGSTFRLIFDFFKNTKYGDVDPNTIIDPVANRFANKKKIEEWLFPIKYFGIDLILLSLYKDNSFDLENFCNALFESIKTKHSKLFKQIKKQNFKRFQDIEFWKNIYKQSLEKNSNHQNEFLENENYKNYYLKSINNFLLDGSLPEYNEETQVFYQFFASFFTTVLSVFVDIYFILRCFKTPIKENKEKDAESSVAIAYYGDAHCDNIEYILTQLMNFKFPNTSQPFYYNIYNSGTFSKNFENINQYINLISTNPQRCVDVSKTFFDLDYLIKQHNDLREDNFNENLFIKSVFEQIKNKIPITNDAITSIKNLINFVFDENGNSILHCILENNLQFYNEPGNFFFSKSENTVEILIKYGINLNHQNQFGQTPLHIFLSQKNLDYKILRLLSTKININITDYKGFTPLHYFFYFYKGNDEEYLEPLLILMKFKPNLNILNKNHENCGHLLLKQLENNFSIIERFKLLLKNNIDINQKSSQLNDESGSGNFLHLCANFTNDKVIEIEKLLFENNINTVTFANGLHPFEILFLFHDTNEKLIERIKLYIRNVDYIYENRIDINGLKSVLDNETIELLNSKLIIKVKRRRIKNTDTGKKNHLENKRKVRKKSSKNKKKI